MQRQSIDQSAVPVLQGVWCPSSASWSEENRETTIKFMAAQCSVKNPVNLCLTLFQRENKRTATKFDFYRTKVYVRVIAENFLVEGRKIQMCGSVFLCEAGYAVQFWAAPDKR